MKSGDKKQDNLEQQNLTCASNLDLEFKYYFEQSPHFQLSHGRMVPCDSILRIRECGIQEIGQWEAICMLNQALARHKHAHCMLRSTLGHA